jgi:carnosine N-methyltransferase
MSSDTSSDKNLKTKEGKKTEKIQEKNEIKIEGNPTELAAKNNEKEEFKITSNDSKKEEKEQIPVKETPQNQKESNINDIMTKMINNDPDWEMHPTEGPIGMTSAQKDPEEYRHLKNIVSAFFNYQIDSLRDVSRMERDFKSLSESHLKRMSFNYTERLDKLKLAIWQNYSFLLKVADPYKNMFKLYLGKNGEVLMEPLTVEIKDIVKMRSTLRLFIRDWAIEGLEERNSTYKPILEELKNFFANRPKKDFEEGLNVLVPGAGLGRLMYEIAKLGFKSQGNEFSYYMLLCSNFILYTYNIKIKILLYSTTLLT